MNTRAVIRRMRIVAGIPRFREIRMRTIRNSPKSGIYDCPICGKIVSIAIDRKTGVSYAKCATCFLRDEIPLEEAFGKLTMTHDVFSRLCDRIYAARIAHFENLVAPEPIKKQSQPITKIKLE